MRLTIARPAPIPARTRRPLPGAEQEAREDEGAEVEREANDILEARAPVERPAERERTEHGQDSQGPAATRNVRSRSRSRPGPRATTTIAIQVAAAMRPSAKLAEATAVEGERHHDRRDRDRGTVLGEPGGDPCSRLSLSLATMDRPTRRKARLALAIVAALVAAAGRRPARAAAPADDEYVLEIPGVSQTESNVNEDSGTIGTSARHDHGGGRGGAGSGVQRGVVGEADAPADPTRRHRRCVDGRPCLAR